MDLDDIAAYFYESCSLYEDPSIDPDDPVAVIDAALLSSDCDDLAWVLSKATGWPAVTVIWDLGNGLTGHHSVLEAEDGRWLDITGWTDLEAISKRVGVEARRLRECEFRHYPFNCVEHADDEGMNALLSAGFALGREPFTQIWLVSAIEAYRQTFETDNGPDTTASSTPSMG